MKHFLSALGFLLAGSSLSVHGQMFKDITTFPTRIESNGRIFTQDSTYLYDGRLNTLQAREYTSYNKDLLELTSLSYIIDANGNESLGGKDSLIYDANNNLKTYILKMFKEGEWVPQQRIEHYYTGIREDSVYSWVYDELHAEWFDRLREYYEYDTNGNMSLYWYADKRDVYAEPEKGYKTDYLNYDENGNPEKALRYQYDKASGEWVEKYRIYYTYDVDGKLTSEEYRRIENNGEEVNSTLNEYEYEDGLMTAYITSTPDWKTKEYVPLNKEEYTYDEEHGYRTQIITSRYISGSDSWIQSNTYKFYWSEKQKPEPVKTEPLARIGSTWKYWVAQMGSYGFNKYEVVKDTVITAELYETGEVITANASWIDKTYSYRNSSFGNREDNKYVASFAAMRIGNASYVYDTRIKKWFKWIDMDAKPGDRWVTCELMTSNTQYAGLYDYVEVSFVETREVDGREIPFIYLIPSCSSRFETNKDFTSRIKMTGYFNIDFWSLYGSPEPGPNGYVYQMEPTEISQGLLCADVNGEGLTTELLEDYIEQCNKPLFDEGVFDCDSIYAPVMPDSKAPEMQKAQKEEEKYIKPTVMENVTIFDFTKEDNIIAQKVVGMGSLYDVPDETDPETFIEIPVVVHVVHNPDTPEEKVTKAQIDDMIAALNEAYGTTQTDFVREPFKDVVGNPYIKFALADEDPEGQPTDGVVYHETMNEYYDLNASQDPRIKYAFKFDIDGTPRNWDHTRYANIYVVDLGGFDQLSTVGGFVTNPDINTIEMFEHYKNWLGEGDPAFWGKWLESEEATKLDGLTVDTWYTFGGASGTNPMATYKTAIHELGHYLGLRHIAIQLVSNEDGSLEYYDDGFSDTPFTHYNQYPVVPCDHDVYQCGNLVQTENYMDYCLECACMFTQEQSAFMRKFISAVRPSFQYVSVEDTEADGNEITLYPNPAENYFCIGGDFVEATIYSVSGNVVKNIPAGMKNVDVSDMPAGFYLLKVKLADGEYQTVKLTVK